MQGETEFGVLQKLRFSVAGESKGLNWRQRQESEYVGIYRPLEGVWVVLGLTETVCFSAVLKTGTCKEMFGSRH